jgi:hypothetical protein
MHGCVISVIIQLLAAGTVVVFPESPQFLHLAHTTVSAVVLS